MTGTEHGAIETYECDVLVAGSGCSGMSGGANELVTSICVG